jgi:hypothetical protein
MKQQQKERQEKNAIAWSEDPTIDWSSQKH